MPKVRMRVLPGGGGGELKESGVVKERERTEEKRKMCFYRRSGIQDYTLIRLDTLSYQLAYWPTYYRHTFTCKYILAYKVTCRLIYMKASVPPRGCHGIALRSLASLTSQSG